MATSSYSVGYRLLAFRDVLQLLSFLSFSLPASSFFSFAFSSSSYLICFLFLFLNSFTGRCSIWLCWSVIEMRVIDTCKVKWKPPVSGSFLYSLSYLINVTWIYLIWRVSHQLVLVRWYYKLIISNQWNKQRDYNGSGNIELMISRYRVNSSSQPSALIRIDWLIFQVKSIRSMESTSRRAACN